VDIEGGAQPMLDHSGRVGVTFNGEIYGYQELRAQLGGYEFQTASDTEALLALYDKYGKKFFEHVPGMFAFALWDDATKCLYCARDRFGEKPFFYALTTSGELIFASEIKAIIASGLVTPRLSRSSLAHYLRRQYVSPSATIYENIAVLPPGHSLIFESGRVTVNRYWSLPAPSPSITLDDAAEQLRSLLAQAVRRQLVADVPVGAFLSGGLDSTTIVHAAKQWSTDIETFSFDFLGSHSEIEFARAAALAYRTRHRELATDHANLPELMLLMRDIYDEPFADTSSIPTYLLTQQARKHVKVALTGDGGDELLGGYAWYKPLSWMEEAKGKSPWRFLIASVMSRLSLSSDSARIARLKEKAIGLGYGRTHRSPLDAHICELDYFSPAELHAMGMETSAQESYAECQLGTLNRSLDAAMRMDVLDYMPGDILTKIDRASMANSLELRAPFLDTDLASFCIGLPACLKVTTYEDKRLLRRAYAESWPESIRTRRKQGFGAPVALWLQRDLIELAHQYLAKLSFCRQVMNADAVRRVVDESWRNIHRDWRAPLRLWQFLVLEIWAERHA
jgi:asparagine synthase (glutamine-hydrolysing)